LSARSDPVAPDNPVEVRASARREEIATKAAELFDAKGFHNASMENIAEAAGVRKPTLYHYFSSKDDILYHIHDQFIEILLQRQERRATASMPPIHVLREIMGDILDLMDTHRGHVRVFFEHRRELSEEHFAAIAEKRTRYERMVRDVFVEGAKEGTLRPVDPEIATLALGGMCTWAYQWYQPNGRLASRDIAYVFWEYLMFGFADKATR
jgi:AcrR family transcriptional regulator